VRWLVAVPFVLAIASAEAAPPRVDWARGLLAADGVGLADRHAPNPAVARGTSRREAEGAARKALAAKLPSLPLASGGTLADKLSDKAVAARVDAAVAGAVVLEADPDTDGSWQVTVGLPLEALRLAVSGARTVAVGGTDSGPAVVVVDGITAKPSLGWTIGGLAAPTLWVDKLPAWAKDAPHVKGKAGKGGAIDGDIAGIGATSATLFVIVTAR
jgi:hypothetical protein